MKTAGEHPAVNISIMCISEWAPKK